MTGNHICPKCGQEEICKNTVSTPWKIMYGSTEFVENMYHYCNNCKNTWFA